MREANQNNLPINQGVVIDALTPYGLAPDQATQVMDGAAPSLIISRISRPFVLGEALKATPYQWLDDLRALVRAPIIVCARWPARLFADYCAHGLDAFVEAPFDLDDLLGLTAVLCAACPANTGEISDAPFAAARTR